MTGCAKVFIGCLPQNLFSPHFFSFNHNKIHPVTNCKPIKIKLMKQDNKG